jgi:hypothetical protein
MKAHVVSSEKKSLGRGIIATIEDCGVECRIWFSATDTLRHVLIGGVQEKADFLGIVQRCEARIDPFVDGQAYMMEKSHASTFLEASGSLVLEYVPEFGG